MFYGELAEDQDEIRIPDVEPPSFLAMLKYVSLYFLHSFAHCDGVSIGKLGVEGPHHPVTLFGPRFIYIYIVCLKQFH